MHEGQKCNIPFIDDLPLCSLQAVFGPSVSGLQYTDDTTDVPTVILVMPNGTFQTPPGGWDCMSRTYSLFQAGLSRASQLPRDLGGIASFENFRQAKMKERLQVKTTAKQTNPNSNETTVMISVGYGEVTDGDFCRIQNNNKSKIGGLVNVGPFSKSSKSALDIKNAAVIKFKHENRRFKKNKSYTLVYGDGSPVIDLPDGSGPFTLSAYKQYKHVAYSRLRLYLCPTDQLTENNLDSSSHEVSPSTDGIKSGSETRNNQDAISQPRSSTSTTETQQQRLQQSVPNVQPINVISQEAQPSNSDYSFSPFYSSSSDFAFDQQATFLPPAPFGIPSRTFSESFPRTTARDAICYSSQGNTQPLNATGQLPILPVPQVNPYLPSHQPALTDNAQRYSATWQLPNHNTSIPIPTRRYGPSAATGIPGTLPNSPISDSMQQLRYGAKPGTHERHPPPGTKSSSVPTYHNQRIATDSSEAPSTATIAPSADTILKTPVGSLIQSFGQTIYAKPVVTFHLFELKARMDFGLEVFWSDPKITMIRLQPKPFAHGGMKQAYKGRIISTKASVLPVGQEVVVKEVGSHVLQAWIEKYGDARTTLLKLTEKEVQAQTLAMLFMEKFRKKVQLRLFGTKPSIIPVYRVEGEGRICTLEKYLGKPWVKYSCNDGTHIQTGQSSDKIAAFIHYVLCKTGYQATVLDLQGVDLELSDPQLATLDESLFGCGNLGEEAISTFVQQHSCTRYCQMAGLPDIREAPEFLRGNSAIISSSFSQPPPDNETALENASRGADNGVEAPLDEDEELPDLVIIDTDIATHTENITMSQEMHNPIMQRQSNGNTENQESPLPESPKKKPKLSCIICFSGEVDTALIPCGHTCCSPCAFHLHLNRKGCHLCRSPIKDTMPIFLPL